MPGSSRLRANFQRQAHPKMRAATLSAVTSSTSPDTERPMRGSRWSWTVLRQLSTPASSVVTASWLSEAASPTGKPRLAPSGTVPKGVSRALNMDPINSDELQQHVRDSRQERRALGQELPSSPGGHHDEPFDGSAEEGHVRTRAVLAPGSSNGSSNVRSEMRGE